MRSRDRPAGPPVGPTNSKAAYWSKGVPGHQAGPHQFPEGMHVLRAIGECRSCWQQGIKERGTAVRKRCQDLLAAILLRLAACGVRRLTSDVPAQPAVRITDGSIADPEDLAGGSELIQHRRRVAGDSSRQDHRLHRTRENRIARELLDGSQHSVDAAAVRADSLPLREEAGKGDLLNWLDAFTQQCQRSPLDQRQHLAVAVLPTLLSSVSRHIEE